MPNPIPTQQRVKVKRREQNRCLRCGGPGREWHHRRSRAVIDEHTHCTCNGVLLCGTCHRWAHANKRQAIFEGVIVKRTVPEPGQYPVTSRHGRITLDCEGNYERRAT